METHLVFKPAVNINEDEKGFRLELVVPGFKKEDLNIEVKQNKLTIAADVKAEKKEDAKGYTRREFKKQSFKRSFSLVENKLDTTKIEAKYEDGILELFLPKKEKEQEIVKTISIK